MLKAGRSLNARASVVEIDGGEVEVVLVEPGLEARDFGTEPAGKVLVGVNGDANLTLLDDGMNFNRAEGVGADAHMHLGIRLQIGGGAGADGRGRRGWGGNGVKLLRVLGRVGGGMGSELGWGGGWGGGGSSQHGRRILPRGD